MKKSPSQPPEDPQKPDWIPINYGNNHIASNKFVPQRRSSSRGSMYSISGEYDEKTSRNARDPRRDDDDRNQMKGRSGDMSRDRDLDDSQRRRSITFSPHREEIEFDKRMSSSSLNQSNDLNDYDDSERDIPNYDSRNSTLNTSVGSAMSKDSGAYEYFPDNSSPSPSLRPSSRSKPMKQVRHTEATRKRSIHVADRYDIDYQEPKQRLKSRANTTYYQPKRKSNSSRDVSPRSDTSDASYITPSKPSTSISRNENENKRSMDNDSESERSESPANAVESPASDVSEQQYESNKRSNTFSRNTRSPVDSPLMKNQKYPKETETTRRRSLHVADKYELNRDSSPRSSRRESPRQGTTYYQNPSKRVSKSKEESFEEENVMSKDSKARKSFDRETNRREVKPKPSRREKLSEDEENQLIDKSRGYNNRDRRVENVSPTRASHFHRENKAIFDSDHKKSKIEPWSRGSDRDHSRSNPRHSRYDSRHSSPQSDSSDGYRKAKSKSKSSRRQDDHYAALTEENLLERMNSSKSRLDATTQQSFFEALERKGRNVSPGGFGTRSITPGSAYDINVSSDENHPIDHRDVVDNESSYHDQPYESKKESHSRKQSSLHQGIDEIVRQELATFEARIAQRLTSSTPILERLNHSRSRSNPRSNLSLLNQSGTSSYLPVSGIPVSARMANSRPSSRSNSRSNVRSSSRSSAQSNAIHSYQKDPSNRDNSVSKYKSHEHILSYQSSHRDILVNNEQTTEAAEWHRLSNWLCNTGMGKYARIFRSHGITKLSVVELLVKDDLEEIMAEPKDIDIMLQNISEFSNQTKALSEQAMISSNELLYQNPSITSHGLHSSRSNGSYGNSMSSQSGSPSPNTPISSKSVASVLSKRLEDSIRKVLLSTDYDPQRSSDAGLQIQQQLLMNERKQIDNNLSYQMNSDDQLLIHGDNHNNNNIVKKNVITRQQLLQQQFQENYLKNRPNLRKTISLDSKSIATSSKKYEELTLSYDPIDVDDNTNNEYESDYAAQIPSTKQLAHTYPKGKYERESDEEVISVKSIEHEDIHLEYDAIYDYNHDAISDGSPPKEMAHIISSKASEKNQQGTVFASDTRVIPESGLSERDPNTPIDRIPHPSESSSSLSINKTPNEPKLHQQLLSYFDGGDGKSFFELWTQQEILSSGFISLSNTFTTTNDDIIHHLTHQLKNSPSLQASISMEFYLLLYFSVFPILKQFPSNIRKEAMNLLKQFIERISDLSDQLASEESSPINSNALGLSELVKSNDFAIYSGIVFIPNPKESPSLSHLFKDEWRISMRIRLDSYLSVMLSSSSSSSIASSYARVSPVQAAVLQLNLQTSLSRTNSIRIDNTGSTNGIAMSNVSPRASIISPTLLVNASGRYSGTFNRSNSLIDINNLSRRTSMEEKDNQAIVSPFNGEVIDEVIDMVVTPRDEQDKEKLPNKNPEISSSIRSLFPSATEDLSSSEGNPKDLIEESKKETMITRINEDILSEVMIPIDKTVANTSSPSGPIFKPLAKLNIASQPQALPPAKGNRRKPRPSAENNRMKDISPVDRGNGNEDRTNTAERSPPIRMMNNPMISQTRTDSFIDSPLSQDKGNSDIKSYPNIEVKSIPSTKSKQSPADKDLDEARSISEYDLQDLYQPRKNSKFLESISSKFTESSKAIHILQSSQYDANMNPDTISHDMNSSGGRDDSKGLNSLSHDPFDRMNPNLSSRAPALTTTQPNGPINAHGSRDSSPNNSLMSGSIISGMSSYSNADRQSLDRQGNPIEKAKKMSVSQQISKSKSMKDQVSEYKKQLRLLASTGSISSSPMAENEDMTMKAANSQKIVANAASHQAKPKGNKGKTSSKRMNGASKDNRLNAANLEALNETMIENPLKPFDSIEDDENEVIRDGSRMPAMVDGSYDGKERDHEEQHVGVMTHEISHDHIDASDLSTQSIEINENHDGKSLDEDEDVPLAHDHDAIPLNVDESSGKIVDMASSHAVAPLSAESDAVIDSEAVSSSKIPKDSDMTLLVDESSLEGDISLSIAQELADKDTITGPYDATDELLDDCDISEPLESSIMQKMIELIPDDTLISSDEDEDDQYNQDVDPIVSQTDSNRMPYDPRESDLSIDETEIKEGDRQDVMEALIDRSLFADESSPSARSIDVQSETSDAEVIMESPTNVDERDIDSLESDEMNYPIESSILELSPESSDDSPPPPPPPLSPEGYLATRVDMLIHPDGAHGSPCIDDGAIHPEVDESDAQRTPSAISDPLTENQADSAVSTLTEEFNMILSDSDDSGFTPEDQFSPEARVLSDQSSRFST